MFFISLADHYCQLIWLLQWLIFFMLWKPPCQLVLLTIVCTWWSPSILLCYIFSDLSLFRDDEESLRQSDFSSMFLEKMISVVLYLCLFLCALLLLNSKHTSHRWLCKRCLLILLEYKGWYFFLWKKLKLHNHYLKTQVNK